MLKVRLLALASVLLLLSAAASAAGNKQQTPRGVSAVASTAQAARLPVVHRVKSIARLVPASIRKHQPLVVPSDSDYPPLEYLAANGKTITGVSAWLMRDIMATLGLRYRVAVVSFDTIIPGFSAGKYIISLAGVNVTPARAQVVNFVTYDRGGDQFIQAAATNYHLTQGIASICGHRIAVLAGSTQLTEVQTQAPKCASPAKVLVYSTQNDVNLALQAGRADFALVDNILPGYLSKTTHGAFKPASKGFNFTSTAGFAVKKGSHFEVAAHAALQHLIKTGVYNKIFAAWGITAAEINSSKIVTH